MIGHQLLRSGTSVAAHAQEASHSRSDAEFASKIDGLLQEANESLLWLELLHEDCHIPPYLILSLIDDTPTLQYSNFSAF